MKRVILPLLLAAAICPAAIQTQGNVAYVVDKGIGQVWVVDLGTRLMDAALTSGAGASEMVVLPGNRLGFVANRDAGTVAVIDLWNNRSLAPIALNQGPGPGRLTATPDGSRVFVANALNNTVSVIDTPTLAVLTTFEVGRTPVQIIIEPRGRYAYTVNQEDRSVSVIDISRNRVVKSLPVGTQPSQMVIVPNRNIAYVLNTGSNNVTLVDLALNEVLLSPVAVGSAPVSAVPSSDGARLYVVNSGSNNISVIHTATNQQTALIATGTRPVAMALKSGSNTGYVANQGSNSLTAIDLATNTAYRQIGVGNQPCCAALDPNQDFLFVTNTGSGTVSIINTGTDSVSSTMPGPGANSAPVQFALLNPPRLLEIAPSPSPLGGTIFLTGEGFVPGARVRVTPPTGLPTTLGPDWLNSQVLQMEMPSYQDPYIVMEVVNADRSRSAPITLRYGTSTPRINPGGVVEAAGFGAAPYPISANALVAVFGDFRGMARADAPAFQFPLPRLLGNAKVTFNGVPAPILATIPLRDYYQINAVVPLNLAAQTEVRVAVTIGDQTSPAERINVAPASSGIFVISQDGAAAAVRSNGSVVSPANAAARGEIISLYVTGLGSTNALPMEGDAAPADPVARTLLPVRVVVAGVDSPKVDFSGLAPGFSGLYQINFQVPSTPGIGLVDVKLIVDTRESNTAKLAIR